MKNSLSVVLVDNNLIRAAVVEGYLINSGYIVVQRLDSTSDLMAQVEQSKPDVIVFSVDSPDRNTFENIRLASSCEPRPTILFTSDSRSSTIRKAIKVGVSAYVIDGLTEKKISSAIEIAVARFEVHQLLRSELDEVKSKLADRKDIDVAKGLLQKSYKMTEGNAYQALRRIAMDQKVTIGSVARSIISISDIVND